MTQLIQPLYHQSRFVLGTDRADHQITTLESLIQSDEAESDRGNTPEESRVQEVDIIHLRA